jgi:hypothetical protein
VDRPRVCYALPVDAPHCGPLVGSGRSYSDFEVGGGVQGRIGCSQYPPGAAGVDDALVGVIAIDGLESPAASFEHIRRLAVKSDPIIPNAKRQIAAAIWHNMVRPGFGRF